MAGGFEALGLMPELLRAIDDLGWNLPTDIQDESIPLILGGGDVMAAAETGSGKTAAFCLPILQCVHERRRTLEELLASSNISTKMQDDDTQVGHNIRMNIDDKDLLVTLSDDALQISSTATNLWTGGRATHGVKGKGKYFYECEMIGIGICRVGWSNITASFELGKDSNGFGYGGTAKKSNNGKFDSYGETFGAGDVISVFLDLDERSISYAKNGKDFGIAFKLPESMQNSIFYPAFAVKGGAIRFNFGTNTLKAPLSRDMSEYISLNFSPKQNIILSTSNSQSTNNTSNISNKKTSRKASPFAVILEPSRDLAEQVYHCLLDFSKYINMPSLRCALLIGQDDYKKQQRDITNGIDILVGTTGKIVELVKSKEIDLSSIKFFVLDEADRLIEPENLDAIMLLFHACPQQGVGDNRLQVCFFSATLHSIDILNVSNQLCHEPTWVDLKGKDSVPETVHHVIYRVDPIRDRYLLKNTKTPSITDNVHISGNTNSLPSNELESLEIKEIKQQILVGIIDKFKMSQCIIFCRTNVDCDNLEAFLNTYSGNPNKKFSKKMETGKESLYSCAILAGMKSVQARRDALEAFKEGYVRILIATDVAARGIDIANLPFVINMTLPDEAENYIHRIGRVGRADKMGLAISIVATSSERKLLEKVWYHTCSNRGQGCTNRKLKTDGGCTIWYDEDSYLQQIEKRLNMKISTLLPSYDLPIELASQNIEYGEENKNQTIENLPSIAHIKTIAPVVQELAELEMNAQNIFLLMKQ